MDRQTTELQNTIASVAGLPGIDLEKPAVDLKKRIASVDALRGLAMFLILATQIGGAFIFDTFNNMVWKNNWPHFVATQLSWDNQRVSFINIAQPIFVFIVGVVIPFSISKRVLQMGKTRTCLSIIRRSLILFLLGLIAGGKLLNLPEYHRTLADIPVYNNVLEYISISYLVCSILVLTTSKRAQYIVTGALLLFYWAIWSLIPAPGWHGDTYSTQMNIGIYVENMVLGNHVSHFGPWTGVFNTVSHISIALIGVLVGHMIFSNRDKVHKTKLLLISGIAMIIAGETWGLFFPIMGCYMTSTFVLVSVGVAVLLLAGFYTLTDVLGYTRWALFFTVFGVNSIAIYMMAHLFDFRLIGNILVGGISHAFPSGVEAFIQAVTAMAIMWLIMYYMYIKKTFIKI
jgi:predicted acyltransferase